MVNQTLVLLSNLPPTTLLPGSEFIPPTFAPVVLPNNLEAARDALIGAGATPQQTVLQVARILTYLHASPLSTDVVAADPRITYDPNQPAGIITGVVPPPVYSFVAAASFLVADGIFLPERSAAEAVWWDNWISAAPAPLRAGSLALAVAARTADIVFGIPS